MIIHQVDFMGSFSREDQCPTDGLPEYAFIGRSNVGKSSLINMLLQRKNLAHTSSTPGKTQTLNYYKINEEWYMVDLPGIGYARVSKRLREKWQRTMEYYFSNRAQLTCIFVLVDSNVPPQKIDIEFMGFLAELQLPFVIVFTKTDKGKTVQIQKNIAAFNRELKKEWEQLPQQFMSSANDRTGRDEILTFIQETNVLINSQH